MESVRIPVAIVGSGNIGTDLMHKVLKSDRLELRYMVGIDADSPGLARAKAAGVGTSDLGVAWLLERSNELEIVFEATTASAHQVNAPHYKEAGLTAIDLTPAKIGPTVVPTVNLDDYLGAPNLNLITCGGQATAPIVAAVSKVAEVPYAETISTVASRSAGPGTRQNIDEFTRTTSRALEEVGGASVGKAIIILNPSEPPILMRNTVFCGLRRGFDRIAVDDGIREMVKRVSHFVPGYRLKAEPVFDEGPFETAGGTAHSRVTVLLEVEGSGDYLPRYAGNLDIMTAAAVRVGEAIATWRTSRATGSA